MRWILWVAFLTLAAGAAAVGVDVEFNPVRTHPHAPAAADSGRIILKLRQSQGSAALPRAARVQLGRQRVAALAARTAMTLRSARAITAELHALVLEPAAGQQRAEVLARLRADREVEYAEPDERRYPHAVPDDPLFATLQWYMQPSSVTTPGAVDAETAWNTTTGSAGIVIADLDTGVRYEHPDLQWAGSGGRLLPGVTIISDSFVANDGDTFDADASDPGDWVTQSDSTQPECSNLPKGSTFPIPSSWHGTRVSGILGALTNNGVGIAGMTWSAWILPVRVLGKCGGADSDIISGMLWAAGVPVDGVPDNPYPARIENMSLGGTGGCPAQYADVVNQLTTMGVLVVASAGNEGGPVDTPANCPGVVGVAGLRHAGTKVGFSSLGPEISLSAPAGNCVNTAPGSPCLYPVTSTVNEGTTTPGANGYTDQLNDPNLGTSFAAPIVSGTAALMLAVNGNLTPAQLIARLKEGTLPFPQTSVGESPQPPVCHVPSGPNDLQTAECICNGQTCGAGMANTSGALNAALHPIAALQLPANVAPGMNVMLGASGSGAACNHTVASYQWVSSDPAGHPVSSANGSSTTVTAPAAGSFTVTLTVTDDAGKQDTATATVGSASTSTSAPVAAGAHACLAAIAVPSPVTISIAPTSGNLPAGSGTQSFTATVDGTLNAQVTWQVNDVAGGNTTVGTVSSAGLYTAPATVPSPAVVTVTAVSAANSARSASAKVTITAAVDAAGGGGGGGGGGAIDVATLLALALSTGVLSALRRHSSRCAASSQGRWARR